MPTVTGPDGRKLRFPEGTDPALVMQVLAEQYPDANIGAAPGQAPAPGTPPGAAPGGPAPAAGGGPGMGAATPTPGGLPEAPVAGGGEAERRFQEFISNEVSQEPWYTNLAAGAGQSVDSTIRGVRQLYNMATGDDEKLAELNAEEAEHRRLNQALLGSGAGRTGQILGYLGQLVGPGLVANAAAKGATVGIPRAGQLASVIGAESALGGATGAVQPTVEGEDRGRNIAVGTALGAGARLAPWLLSAGTKAAGAKVGIAPATAALSAALRKYAGASDPAADAVRKAAGDTIGRITSSVNVPLRGMARELDSIGSSYGSSLPDPVRAQLSQLAALGRNANASLKGERAQEMMTAIAREAQESGGITQSGLERLMRALTRGIEKELPKSQVRRLRQARTEYRTGRSQPGVGTLAPTVISYGTAVGTPDE